ncbi:MAG TPA: flavin reductase family protein [Candidatus Acidoferrales bacterium]|nr:flavin reductase family protein [Candidatus Acidoferrales bacterium]
MVVDPATAEPGNVYKLLIGAIVPRPIAFVSSLSADGIPNLAPFSFFTAISANPPVVCFSPMIRSSDLAHKDTLNNIEATREFVVNIVSEEFAEKMNICSGEYPPEVDEFQVSGLTPVPSDLVKPARVKESHVNMECRLVQVVRVSEKLLGGSIVLGEVVRFHVDDAIVEDFRIEPEKLRAIGRMGGSTYARTTDRFELRRPKK